MALGDVIGRLSVVLGLDTAAFETGAKRAAKTTVDAGDRMEALGAKVGTAAKAMVGLGVAIAGSELVQQIKDLTIAGLEYGKQIDTMSKLSNASAGEFQRAAYAARTVGIETEKLADIYKDVNDKVGDFLQNGGGPLKDFFDNIAPKVGVTAEQFRGLSGPQALQLYVSSLEKANLSQAELTFYMEAIANDATRLLPLLQNSGAAMAQLGRDAEKAGVILSEEQIKKSVDALDKYNAMLEIAKIKQAEAAADNSEGVLKGLESWEQLKVQAIVTFGKIAEGYAKTEELVNKMDQADPWETIAKGWQLNIKSAREDMDRYGKAFDAWLEETKGTLRSWGDKLAELGKEAIESMRKLYEGVKTWIGNRLDEVWDGLKGRIDNAKKQFFGLYDSVVGHSYIPDMVDGIAFHMARLDREMVEPAKKATTAVAGFFKDLDADIRGMMDDLFPDARNLADFQNKLLKFDKAIAKGGAGGYSVDQLRAGRSALIDGLDPALRSQVALPLADQLERFGNIDLGNTAPIDAALKAMTEAANDNADKIGVANVAISKSFKDMADATLSALDRMVGAIKGGGFLDILGSVINLGLQLGSIGLFGKSVQSSINAIPAHANGTNFAPGGLSLVGERGPELVNLPRGSQVIPNHALRGMGGGNTYHISGNLMTPEFWAKIQQGDMQAAAAGARGGEARMIYRQNRKVA